MSKSIYVASSEARSGKSLAALGLMELASRRVGRVGFFRPVVREEGDGGLESRWTTTYDQDTRVRPLRRNAFGMPALSPFLSHRGVLRTRDGCTRLIAGVAHVAADTLSDLVFPTLVDLPRKEWIGNGRSRCSNQVDDALAHQP